MTRGIYMSIAVGQFGALMAVACSDGCVGTLEEVNTQYVECPPTLAEANELFCRPVDDPNTYWQIGECESGDVVTENYFETSKGCYYESGRLAAVQVNDPFAETCVAPSSSPGFPSLLDCRLAEINCD